MKTVINLGLDGTWSASAEQTATEEEEEMGLVLSIKVGNTELLFPLLPAQALGLGMAFMQRAPAPSQKRETDVAAAPRESQTVPTSLPAEEALPVAPDIRKSKRHTHRHCEVCNEAICLLVKRQDPQQYLDAAAG
jgi:hypothetical protein